MDLSDVKGLGGDDSDSVVYKTLLESTRAIPWKIDWATMKFAYIGPQIEPLLGWSQDSWLTVDDRATRMHPEDRDYVVNFCVAQSKAGVDHEADYRALTKDNGYVWIRDVVHVVRKPDGEVEALIGFMFDITERKKTEEKLLALQKELEALSFKDGLTNIANGAASTRPSSWGGRVRARAVAPAARPCRCSCSTSTSSSSTTTCTAISRATTA